ncbi:hypothetical protein N7G274_008441 [Stereocaulon virgatum]|uniref:Uncharacterized protein n=1 Tax=Stereocaulon virgatum TaxID=373712 RepID=A0ABR3ZZ71_9LECA
MYSNDRKLTVLPSTVTDIVPPTTVTNTVLPYTVVDTLPATAPSAIAYDKKQVRFAEPLELAKPRGTNLTFIAKSYRLHPSPYDQLRQIKSIMKRLDRVTVQDEIVK